MGRTNEQAGERRNYFCVQALRAVAAALVVAHHSISLWLQDVMHRTGGAHWNNGAAGVDVFFVISGFVMAISLPGLAGKRNKAGEFLRRRFTRIVPLYWAALTVRLAQLAFWPSAAADCILTPWRIAASYLFIPVRNGAGNIFPVVTVGWTLNYEVFFYVLFAVALALDVAPLVFLAPCLTALALAGTARTDAWPAFASLASPLVIEFLFGMILARIAMRRRLPGAAAGVLLLAGGFAALLLMPEASTPWGVVNWGLPAAAMVAGAVALEPVLGRRLPKWLLEAGDASYALYLSHTFILPYVGNVINALHITGGPALAAAITMGLAVSFPVGVLIHRHVEKPLMNLLKKRPETPQAPVAPLAAASPSLVSVE